MSTTITQNSTSPTYIISTLGLLTTVFTPAPSCTPSTTTTRGQLVLADCMPPSFTPSDDVPTGVAVLNFYSPGVCPSGYTSAAQISPGLLTADETGQRCCPLAYAYTLVFDAQRAVSTCARTPAGAAPVWAPDVPVVWRARDFATWYRTVTAGGLGEPDPTATPAPTEAPPGEPGSGAKIAGGLALVAVAVGVGVVLVCVAVRWRRGRAGVRPPGEAGAPELGGVPVCEVSAESKAPRVELE